MRIRDVMQTDLATIGPDADLRQLDELLLERRIQGVPVVSDGRVVGLISRSDVVRQLHAEESRFEAEIDFYLSPFDEADRRPGDERAVSEAVAARLRKLRVKDAMTEGVISVTPDAEIAEAARTMAERRIHRLLVLEGDRLVGLVSSLDLLRLVAEGRLVAP